MTTEPLAAVDDAARHPGVSRDTAYRWIEGKGLPAQKLGRLWKFKFSEVEARVRARGTEVPSDKGERDE